MAEKITLEQAREVINAHHEAERAQKRKELLPLVGKHFKYWNNYGVGGRSRGWWLYAQVTGVDEMGMCIGWSFQRDENDKIEIEPDSRMTITIEGTVVAGSNWQSVDADEFWEAARQVKQSIHALLTRPEKEKTALRRRASSVSAKASER